MGLQRRLAFLCQGPVWAESPFSCQMCAKCTEAPSLIKEGWVGLVGTSLFGHKLGVFQ